MYFDDQVNRTDLSAARLIRVEPERHFLALPYFAMHYLKVKEIIQDSLQKFVMKLCINRGVFKNEERIE